MKFRLVEDNELQKRAKYHAKKRKGRGYFVKLNAGNPEYNAEFFNHAMGSDAGAPVSGGEAMGEDYEVTSQFEDPEKRLIRCEECDGEFPKDEMTFSKDCWGIPFRMLCPNCYDDIMNSRGYDGEYYTSEDEQIEPDY